MPHPAMRRVLVSFEPCRLDGATGGVRSPRCDAPPPPVAPPPPPPPPPVAGLVTLHCAPAECDVTVNGKSRSTTGGALELPGLPVGEATVDFKKDGFEPQQIAIESHRRAARQDAGWSVTRLQP